MASIPHVGDIGTVISVDTGEDISAATLVRIVAEKPSGDTVLWTGSVDDTAINYVVEAGDLDEEGSWRIQGYVELPGWSGYSTTATVSVGERIADAVIL